jgi:hypothetical protein
MNMFTISNNTTLNENETLCLEFANEVRGVCELFYARDKETGIIRLFANHGEEGIKSYGEHGFYIGDIVLNLYSKYGKMINYLNIQEYTSLVCLYLNYTNYEDIESNFSTSIRQSNVIVRKTFILGIMDGIIDDREAFDCLDMHFDAIDSVVLSEISTIISMGLFHQEQASKYQKPIDRLFDMSKYEPIKNHNLLIAMEQYRGLPICQYEIDLKPTDQ